MLSFTGLGYFFEVKGKKLSLKPRTRSGSVRPMYRYDLSGNLRISPLLWILFLYGIRHLVVFFASIFVPHFPMPDVWAHLQNQRMLLVSDFLVLFLMFVAGHRTEKAHRYWRWLWHLGRQWLMAAIGLDLVMFLWLNNETLYSPLGDGFLLAIFVLMLDVASLRFLYKNQLIADIFNDFPRPVQVKTTPVSLGSEVTELEALDADASGWHGRGLVALELGRLAQAAICIRKAVDLAPQDIIFCRDLVEVYRNLGNASQAVFYGKRCVNLAPNDADLHVHLALALNDAGQVEGAVASCRRALEIDPNHLTGWVTLGVLLCNQGDSQTGRQSFEQALTIAPDCVAAKINLSAFVNDACAVRFANELAPSLAYFKNRSSK